MAETGQATVYATPRLEAASLVVAWSEDAGRLGPRTVEYLNRKLSGQAFAEIEPLQFHPMGGVSVENDVARFPESKFWWCPGKELALFRSNPPGWDWYDFLNVLLDVARDHCRVREVYTVGGMVSMSAHTTPRRVVAVANSPQVRDELRRHGVESDVDFETPAGQRPTLSTFLLWVARRRNIPAVSLWVPVPFYLVSTEDPRGWKKVLEFFDQRMGLGLDLSDVEGEVVAQNERIASAKVRFPELEEYVLKLERNLTLTEEESQRLVRGVEEALGRKS